MKTFNKLNYVTYDCHYHIIFTPKYRLKLLKDEIAEDLKKIIEELKFEIKAMEVMEDHVHLLLNIAPQLGVHKVVKRIKGRSSRQLRAKYQELRSRAPTLWTHAYFCSTVGNVSLDKIKQYVEDQKTV